MSSSKSEYSSQETKAPNSTLHTPPNCSLNKRIKRHLSSSVRPSTFAEFQLVLLTICTGIQDAISFPDYHCFASNQTGNTVFLVLAVVLPETHELFITANIGVALGLFLAGGWLTGQLSHLIGARKRWWLILTNFIQTCLVFAASAIQYGYGIQTTSTATLVVLGLLAFAAGSQVVQSRSLAMTEISTAMATAAWVDLMIDQKLFVLNNRSRTRRIFFILGLVLGTFIGAGVQHTIGSAPAILISAAGKLLVTIMYFFNSAEQEEDSCCTV